MGHRAVFAICVSFVFAVVSFCIAQANVPDVAPPVDKMERAVEFKLPPQTTESERAQYFPTLKEIDIMRVHLQHFYTISAEETHTPIQTLQVGVPYKPGVVVYFAQLPNADYVWILEEWVPYGKGFRVAFWWFLEIENIITYFTIDIGIKTIYSPATEYVNSSYPRWSEAVEKSKQAWKILCDAHLCSTDAFPP